MAYQTWGRLNADRRQRGPGAARAHRRRARRRAGRAGPADAGLVGRADRPRRAGRRPRATSWWRPMCSAGAGAPPARRRPAPDGRPWGSRFPYLTVRDQVAAEHALADRLGITSFAATIGGSMGGMRALEWAVMYPDQVRRVAASPPVLPSRPIRSPGAQRSSPRSGPIRASRAATTTRPAGRRRPGWPWPGRSPTSPTAAMASWVPGSAGIHNRARIPPIAVGTPCSPTSTTTATSWSGGSTRTPTWRSPRR